MTSPTLGFESIYNRADERGSNEQSIMSVLAKLGTPMPVEVVGVYEGGVSPTGFVDVKFLIHQIDGLKNPVPHGVLYKIPFIRIQGGSSAVICDPVVGDNGFVVVAGRDMANVSATRAASPPGSFRVLDWGDAVYFGGLLNAAPTEYVRLSGNGITVVTPGGVSIQAQGAATIAASSLSIDCNVSVQGSIRVSGDVSTEAGVTLNTHVHPNVQPGSGQTGQPTG